MYLNTLYLYYYIHDHIYIHNDGSSNQIISIICLIFSLNNLIEYLYLQHKDDDDDGAGYLNCFSPQIL